MSRSLHFVLLLLPTLMASVSAGAAFPEVMFILDGSGSMEQADTGGMMKIDAAKQVLNKVVPQLPPEVRVGFAAYGHRQPKDCSDVEVIIPPGSEDRTALLAEANAIQPRGMTPISLAVTQVANTLQHRKAETTIILISDGQETCGGDPCQVVATLKQSGIKFVLHVVGFDVGAGEKEQLECMARAGGGQYFAAGDATALLAALEKVAGDIAEKVEQAKTKTVRRGTSLGKLRITMPENALKSLAGFKIIRSSDGKVLKEGELGGADTTHPLLKGEYELFLKYANPNYKDPDVIPVGAIEIKGGETAIMAFGAIAYNIAEGLTGSQIEGVVIMDSATQTPLLTSQYHGNGYYQFKPKPMLPGMYDVTLQYARSEANPVVVARDLDVTAGKEAYITLDSGFQLEEPSGSSITAWDLIPTGRDKPLIAVTRRWDNSFPLYRTYIVPPGTYDLMVTIKGMNEPLPVGEGLEIRQGETLRFNSGL